MHNRNHLLTTSRRNFLTLLGTITGSTLFSAAAPTTPAAAPSTSDSAQPPATATPEIIEQKTGTGSCGPCAVANSLLHGDPAARRAYLALPGQTSTQRLDALIARYGTKPSETYGPARSRFVSGSGIATGDMPHFANDLLASANLPGVQGDWLDQLPAERDHERAHLHRVHALFRAALVRGFPPVVEVRAFTTDHATPAAPWTNFYAHWLTLLHLDPPADLPAAASGFACHFADSFTGRIIPAFAYAERFRPFMATRGFTLRSDGSKDWHWLTGHPYILLQLPDVPMNLESAPPQERAVIALTYLVHRPGA